MQTIDDKTIYAEYEVLASRELAQHKYCKQVYSHLETKLVCSLCVHFSFLEIPVMVKRKHTHCQFWGFICQDIIVSSLFQALKWFKYNLTRNAKQDILNSVIIYLEKN